MSSTNRGAQRQANDYYVTPVEPIIHFLGEFYHDLNDPLELGRYFSVVPNSDLLILDPCAGGDADHGMSYPTALSRFEPWKGHRLQTYDIREDSLAAVKTDYLAHRIGFTPHLIITNPPFHLAVPIIQKALRDVRDGGMVIMLQRLNFFGSGKRKEFWKTTMPLFTYTFSERMSFETKRSCELAGKEWKPGQTDSIEYAHFVWKKHYYPPWTRLRVI